MVLTEPYMWSTDVYMTPKPSRACYCRINRAVYVVDGDVCLQEALVQAKAALGRCSSERERDRGASRFSRFTAGHG